MLRLILITCIAAQAHSFTLPWPFARLKVVDTSSSLGVWDVEVSVHFPSSALRGGKVWPSAVEQSSAVSSAISEVIALTTIATSRSVPNPLWNTASVSSFDVSVSVGSCAKSLPLEATMALRASVAAKLGVDVEKISVTQRSCSKCDSVAPVTCASAAPSSQECRDVGRALLCAGETTTNTVTPPRCAPNTVSLLDADVTQFYTTHCTADIASLTSPQTAKQLDDDGSLTVAGTLDVVVEMYADGTMDNYAIVHGDDGSTTIVDAPDTNNLIELSPWNHLRTGDRVTLGVDAVATPPRVHNHGNPGHDDGMGMGSTSSRTPRHKFLRLTERVVNKDKRVDQIPNVRLLTVRVVYTDSNPDAVCTTSCLTGFLFTRTLASGGNVNDVTKEQSYNKASYDEANSDMVTVTVAKTAAGYDECNKDTLGTIGDDADAAVDAQTSINRANYDTTLYFTGAICGIGVAYVGGDRAFINDDVADSPAHELGHNRGWNHASVDSTDSNVLVTNAASTTSETEYGDRSDFMGFSLSGASGLRAVNLPHRLQFNYITSGIEELTFDGCSTITRTLQPLFRYTDGTSGTFGIRALRRNLGRYFVSFRNQQGYDIHLSSANANKVFIHYQLDSGDNTVLITRLIAGQSWSNTENDISVSVSSLTTDGAVVTVSYCRPSQFAFSQGTIACGQTKTGDNTLMPLLLGSSAGTAVYSIFMQQGTYTFDACNSAIRNAVYLTDDGAFTYEEIAGCDWFCGCGSGTTTNSDHQKSRFSVTIDAASVGWHTVYLQPNPWNGAHNDKGAFSLSVSCTLVGSASPTKSISVSSSRTPSLSPSPSVSPSTTRSPTRTRSSSPSASPSKTATPTTSGSRTPTRSPAASRSSSPSPSGISRTPSTSGPPPSTSPTKSFSKTVSITPSVTPTFSLSGSVTRSATATSSVTRSAAPSPSPSRTRAVSLCGTGAKKSPCTQNNQCLSCKCNTKKFLCK